MKKRITKIKLVNLGCMHFYSRHILIIDSKTNKVSHSNVNTSGFFPSFKSIYKINHKDIKDVFTIIQPIIENWKEKYLVPGFSLDGDTVDFYFDFNDGTKKIVRITYNYGPVSFDAVLQQIWSLRNKETEEEHKRFIKNPTTPLSKLKNPKSHPTLQSPIEKRITKVDNLIKERNGENHKPYMIHYNIKVTK